jgi:hypothetical protein
VTLFPELAAYLDALHNLLMAATEDAASEDVKAARERVLATRGEYDRKAAFYGRL